MRTKAFPVARWEFIEKVKTKAFIISLLMLPVIIGVFAVLPGILASKADNQTRSIGIIDQTDTLASLIAAKLNDKFKLPDGRPNYRLVEITDSDTSLDHLKKLATAKILGNEIEGYFILPADVMSSGKVEYRAENVGNIRDQERFSSTIEDVVVEKRLIASGFDAQKIKALTTKVDIKTIKISSKGEEKESGFLETFFSGYIFIMMLMFLVITSGQMLIRSVVEEKSNRIVEVLLSSCSPMELMTGKVLGLTLLGLTTVSFWILILSGVNFTTHTPFLSVDHLLLLIVFFVLGYLLYAAIFVAVGAPLNTEQEAQQMTSYISLLLVFPIALAVPIMQDPNSLLAKILTFIPIFTPTFMALRLSIQLPEWWEIVLSLLILTGSIVFMMWAASKIFRIGILLTGKRPNMKEIVRWLRTNV
ncbi:MAG: ABC transporter permease [Bacteroidota bacterium]|nr:ABC transporter permease [Bacteroidota bacterium]